MSVSFQRKKSDTNFEKSTFNIIRAGFLRLLIDQCQIVKSEVLHRLSIARFFSLLTVCLLLNVLSKYKGKKKDRNVPRMMTVTQVSKFA